MTTEHKHTPGPWLIHGALLGHKGDVFSPTAEKVTDCHHIARCYAPKPAEPVLSDLHAIGVKREAIAIIEANARLIAAAPDLLEALKMVLGKMDDWNQDGPTIQAIKATIAKAEAQS